MIRFKSMSWDHAFSYGPSNYIDFTNPLVQLVGKNGHGKSSIALILEEALFNKNSKGVKKANILNRYSRSKSYNISLEFEKDSSEYYIETVRGSTQTVKLIKDGVDISAHTSTATYKLIEEILGYDHKTFTQIVYQNNAFSLEFLTATDTNRKKFLIELLNLNRYTEIADKIKLDLKSITQDADLLNKQLNTVVTWLAKYNPADLVPKQLLTVPAYPDEEAQKVAQLQEKYRTLDSTNRKIIQNNKYIEILNSIQLEILPAPTTNIVELKVKSRELSDKVSSLLGIISKTGKIISNCPACGQPINTDEHKRALLEEAKQKLPEVEEQLKLVSNQIKIAEREEANYNKSCMQLQEWEKYSSLADKSMPTVLLDAKEISTEINRLENFIQKTVKEIDSINAKNVAIEAHNAKAQVILEQMQDMLKEKKTLEQQLSIVNYRITNLQILVKTFSPSGFIAYKIESLVKDLENLVNNYLAEMSDGRFQLSFKISSSDKLDVVITDNGDDIEISALSNGELARVNISTLLAIRKLMQSLSNTRTNLLILDETVENLDADGKEKLVEMLLAEESLNTILVSHGFSHPLLTKIEVVKENNVSRIEK